MSKINLFAYGTLQKPEILIKVIGRDVEKNNDYLDGYKKITIEINNSTYPALVKNSQANERVCGKVLKIEEDDFEKLDEYETNAYKRELLTLESGENAWVYIKKDNV